MFKIPYEIATQVGCSKHMIKKINQGTRPSLKLAIRIVETMNGDTPRLTELIPELRKAFEIIIKQGVG